MAGVPQAAPPASTDDVAVGTGSGATNNAITLAAGTTVRSVDFTGYTGTFTHNAATTLSVGDASGGALKFVSGMTYTKGQAQTSAITYTSTSTNGGVGWPITTAGKVVGNTTFNGVGGKWQLQDALTASTSSTLGITNGHLDTNNVAISMGLFGWNNGNTKALTLGTTIFTLTSNGTNTVWSGANSTGSTLSAASSTIVVSASSGGGVTRHLRLGGLTYGTITYTAVGGGTPTLTMYQSNTINTLNVSGGVRELSFEAGTTQTITNFNVFGTAGNLVTISSQTPTSAATLTKGGGGVVSTVDYVSIQDSTPTDTSTWYAGANSTNVSNTGNWIFTAAPSGTSKKLALLGVG